MADDIASLGIRIDSSQAKSAAADLDRLSASGARAERSAAGIESAFAGLRGVLGGVSAALVVRRIVESADAWSNLTSRLKLATDAAGDFATAQAAIFDISQRTRVGLEQTTDLYASLARSTEDLGVSQSEVLGVTETINQALVVSGRNAQSAAAALVQLGQGFASGTLRGEELNSVLEQAPRLARAIADGLGVPIGQLRKLGQEGELTASKVFQALQRSAGDIQREFARMPLTVQQASTQAANSLLKFIGAVNETSGATASLAGVISGAASAISELADEVSKAARGEESVSGLASAFVGLSDLASAAGEAIGYTLDRVGEAVGLITDNTKEWGLSWEVVVDTVKVVWLNVKFVLEAIGREIAAVEAQLQALARLDFSGFSAISDAVTEDGKRAREELDKTVAAILATDSRLERRQLAAFNDMTANERQRLEGRLAPPRRRPGSGDDGKNADAIRKAQLAADLADYKRALQQFTAAFSANEAILDARRSAGLVDEKAYYDAKIGFVRLNTEAEVRALQQEKARLERENRRLTGKKDGDDRIKNLARIRDVQAEIDRLNVETAGKVEVLAIQQTAALEQVRIAYESAKAAADLYLQSIANANRRDLDGMGQGRLQREIDGRRNQRDDQLINRTADLNSQLRANQITQEQYDSYLQIEKDAHAAALEEDQRYWSEKLKKQGDWAVGASEALRNYLDDAHDVSSQVESLFTNAFQGMEDALVEFIKTGKLDFKSLADSIVADIARIIVKQQIANAVAAASEYFKGSSFGQAAGSFFSGLLGGRANGGPVQAGGLYEVNERGTPEVLSVGGRDFLMMGATGGNVKPTAAGAARTINVTNQFTINGPVDRRTQTQMAAEAAAAVSRAAARVS